MFLASACWAVPRPWCEATLRCLPSHRWNDLIILSQTPVQGRACFNMAKAAVFMGENVFDAAVADALAKHEGATVLANAEFIDDGSCVEVSGLPARF